MKFFIYLLLLQFTFQQSYSAPKIFFKRDSLVKLSELDFHSELEKQSFYSLLNKNKSEFEVLMSINNVKSADLIAIDKDVFDQKIEKLKQIPVPRKKKVKYLKNLYLEIHKQFLTNYEPINYFANIFKNGTYNCVTACSLYTLIFKEMGLSFFIKESPTHVFLTVYLDDEQILIETTDPIGGFYELTANHKSDLIHLLNERNLVSDSAYQNHSTEELFDLYYDSKNTLTLKELVALQYSNDAIYHIREMEFEKSILPLRKSHLLYDREVTRNTLLFALSNLIRSEEYFDMEGVNILALLSRFDESFVTDVEIETEFLRITEKMLVNRNNLNLYESAYNYLLKNINRPNLVEEIELSHTYQLGKYFYSIRNYEKSLPYLENSFEHDPEVETLFLSCLNQVLAKENNTGARIDRLQYFLKKFKILSDNRDFGGLYLNQHLLQMAELYGSNKFVEGEYLKSVFEQIFTEHPNYKIKSNLVGKAYSQLAVYYFKASKYAAAKSAIGKGLEYAPENMELQSRKRMLNP
ncbi:MAG: hypothetical protein ACJA2S_000983 [Cyclobacteriaceae bacterium]|jgi:hypothetical protein